MNYSNSRNLIAREDSIRSKRSARQSVPVRQATRFSECERDFRKICHKRHFQVSLWWQEVSCSIIYFSIYRVANLSQVFCSEISLADISFKCLWWDSGRQDFALQFIFTSKVWQTYETFKAAFVPKRELFYEPWWHIVEINFTTLLLTFVKK